MGQLPFRKGLGHLVRSLSGRVSPRLRRARTAATALHIAVSLAMLASIIATVAYDESQTATAAGGATTLFMEPGGDSTGDTSLYTKAVAGSSTIAAASDQKETGPNSIKATVDGSGNTAYVQADLGSSLTAGRVSFFYRMAALPGSSGTASLTFMRIMTPGNATNMELQVDQSGHISVNPAGFLFPVLSTATVAVNTWYQFTFTWSITSTSTYTLNLFLNSNPTPSISVTAGGTLTQTTARYLRLGSNASSSAAAGVTEWFDNVYADNSSSGQYLGDVRVTAKRPAANGSSNQFTTQVGAGGSGYGTGHSPLIHERPLSSTNGWTSTVTAGTKVENYTLEASSAGDVDISGKTVVGYTGWVYAAWTGSGGNPTNKVILNGSSVSVTLTTSPALYMAGTYVDTSTYPSGSGIIGLDHTGTGRSTTLYEAGVLVSYVSSPNLRQSAYRWLGNDLNAFGTNGIVTVTSGNAMQSIADGPYLYTFGTGVSANWRIEKRLLTDGSLVSSFGTAGAVTGVGGSNIPVGMAIDSNYLYAVGSNTSGNWRIEKRSLDTGALDLNFGTSGIIGGAAATEVAYDVVVTSTSLFIAGSTTTKGLLQKRSVTTGALDAGFGTGGEISLSGTQAQALATDGTNIYVATDDNASSTNNKVLKVLASTGASVSSFNGIGFVSLVSQSTITDLILDGSDLYILGDTTSSWLTTKRLQSDGSLVTAFGSSGVLTTTTSATRDPYGYVSGGNLYIAGKSSGGGSIHKYDSTTSTEDTTFQVGASDVFYAVEKIGFDGTYLYLPGSDTSGDLHIEKRSAALGSRQSNALTTLGAQDTSVATAEQARLRVVLSSSGTQYPASYKLRAATKVGGACGDDETFADVASASGNVRFHDNPSVTDGSAYTATDDDPKYSGQANVGQTYVESNNASLANVTPTNYGAAFDFSLTMASASVGTYCLGVFNTDNSNLAGGYGVYPEVVVSTVNTSESAYRFFDKDQTGFGSNGVVNPTSAFDVHAMALDSSYVYDIGATTSPNWFIEKRSLSIGAPITTFGSGGTVTGAALSAYARAIAIDSTYMYVAGSDDNGNWRIEKRLLSDGSLDTGFGTAGVVTDTGQSGAIETMAIDSTYMYVAGTGTGSLPVLQKRQLSNGALDSGFGSSGVVTSGSANIAYTSIAIDSTYAYLTYTDTSPDWRIEKRQLSNGALASAFGTSGVVTAAAASKTAYGLRIDATYMWVYGTDSSNDWRIERRLLSDGSLVAGFGTSGVSTSAAASNAPYTMVIDSASMYIGGDDASGQTRIEKRLLGTGALVTSFGSSGILTGTDATSFVQGAAVNATTLYYGSNVAGTGRLESVLATTGAHPTTTLTPLAEKNAAASVTNNATRLRLTLSPSVAQLGSGVSYKLRYAPKVGGVCGDDETFGDVSTSSGDVRFYDNVLLANGGSITSDTRDPYYLGKANVLQTAVESNNFSTTSAISTAQSALWDISLTTTFATVTTTYCFKVTNTDNSALSGSYVVYPELTAIVPVNTAPNAPTSLTQKTVGLATIGTGGWINASSVVLGGTVSDADNPDTLQLCVEVKDWGTSFDGTESCTALAAYSGTGLVQSVTASGLTNGMKHWRARTKDTAGATSSWVIFTGSDTQHFGIDTETPAVGTVFDGTSAGVDATFNDSSLSQLSANWSGFSDGYSGLQKYQYAIGTSSGGTDVRNWTDNSTSTSVTATGLSLVTSQRYFISVRYVDVAGNTSSAAVSDGQLVAPTLTFSLSTSTLDLGHLSALNSFTATNTLTLTTATNAANGYIIQTSETQSLTSGGSTIADYASTAGSPTTWTGFGFGYTASGGSALSTFATNKYAHFASAAAPETLVNHPGTIAATPITNESETVTIRTSTPNTQRPGVYTTTLLWTCIPNY